MTRCSQTVSDMVLDGESQLRRAAQEFRSRAEKAERENRSLKRKLSNALKSIERFDLEAAGVAPIELKRARR